jgi:hypothetical protein
MPRVYFETYLTSLSFSVIRVTKVAAQTIFKYDPVIYEGGSKSFRPDQLFKVTEIKICYFSI